MSETAIITDGRRKLFIIVALQFVNTNTRTKNLFRNVVRIELALQEAFRVLKPGGRFMCLGDINNIVGWIIIDCYSFISIVVILLFALFQLAMQCFD